MVRCLVVIVACLFAVLPASASEIEDVLAPTGLHYQEDAGVAGDAPAFCEEATAARSVTYEGAESAGMLVEADDEADVYVLNLTPSEVGERVFVNALGGLAVSRYDVALDVLAPGCGSSVLDAESPYYDPAPVEPYVAPPGQAVFEAEPNPDHPCDGAQWDFTASGLGDAQPPADVYVEWTNGEYEYVPFAFRDPEPTIERHKHNDHAWKGKGKGHLGEGETDRLAHYAVPENLEFTVARMAIVMPATWTGDVQIGSGPCDAVPGTPPAPPESSLGHGEFTVQEAGPHIIRVFIGRSTVDKTTDTVQDLVEDPPTSIPVSCHRDLCSMAVAEASYGLGSGQAA